MGISFVTTLITVFYCEKLESAQYKVTLVITGANQDTACSHGSHVFVVCSK